VNPTRPTWLEFSPDGEWLGAAGCFGARLLPRDGGAPIVLDDEGYLGECSRRLHFAADGDHVALSPSDQSVVRIWSLSKGEEVKRFEWEGATWSLFIGNRLLMDTAVEGKPVVVREYDLDSAELRILERWDARGLRWWQVGSGGRRVALTRVDDPRVFVRPFWGQEPVVERVVGRHGAPAGAGALSPRGDRLASTDSDGEIRIWSLDPQRDTPLRTLRAEGWVQGGVRFDPSGTKLAVGYGSDDAANTVVRVWDLEGPQGADPVALRTTMYGKPFHAVAFDPTSRRAAVAYIEAVGFFPLERRAYVLPGRGRLGGDVAFTPDGRSLMIGYEDSPLVRTWRLDGSGRKDLDRWGGAVKQIAVGPGGRNVLVAGLDGAFLVSLSDGAARALPDTSPRGRMDVALDISADGRLAAAICTSPPEQKGIRVWDLESLELRVLEESRGRDVRGLAFASDGTLFSSDTTGVVSRWDLRTNHRTTFAETGEPTVLALSPNGRHLLVTAGPWLTDDAAGAVTRSTLHDLDAGTSRSFTSHGTHVTTAAFDPTSRWIVTGDRQGVVRVGPLTGETPHLLLGHGTPIRSVAFSPDGRWIASSEVMASTVRLWPMPEGLITRLRTMTNLRAVPDATSPMGYRIEVGPFPGWAAAGR
jgi:WD40 repeat protein